MPPAHSFLIKTLGSHPKKGRKQHERGEAKGTEVPMELVQKQAWLSPAWVALAVRDMRRAQDSD